MREYAAKFREHSVFICDNDKHRIKVGEPGYPLAAAERGCQVVVSLNQSFQVGNHDFSCFSQIPSVNLEVHIPDSIDGSWYQGKVFIGFKDAAFDLLFDMLYTELYSSLLERIGLKSMLFLYTDGGPDHRLTYASVQLALIALFQNLNLDILVAGTTAPHHSWRNPVE